MQRAAHSHLSPLACALAAAGGFARDLRALLPGLVEADRDRLLAALHRPSRAALESPLLSAVHRGFHVLRCRFAVLRHCSSLGPMSYARSFLPRLRTRLELQPFHRLAETLTRLLHHKFRAAHRQDEMASQDPSRASQHEADEC